MIYLNFGDDNRILVLETENLEEIKKGRPIATPDGLVAVAWTPDPEWLAQQIMNSDGTIGTIAKLVDESTKRPQRPLRARHRTVDLMTGKTE